MSFFPVIRLLKTWKNGPGLSNSFPLKQPRRRDPTRFHIPVESRPATQPAIRCHASCPSQPWTRYNQNDGSCRKASQAVHLRPGSLPGPQPIRPKQIQRLAQSIN